MANGTVLTIDDDPELQNVLRHHLEDDDYAVLSAMSGKDATDILVRTPVDVILLDLTLPDIEGFSLIGGMRRLTKAPIIIVSGKSDTIEKIVGLEMGADDYLTKPFEMRELTARIKVVMRRAKEAANTASTALGEKNDKIRFLGWTLDRLQLQLFNEKGQSVDLTVGEFRLLETLAMAPNRVLTRDYLFELTRECEFESYDRAVDIQIGRIRKKMGDDPKSADIIKTVRGAGYMFCAAIDN